MSNPTLLTGLGAALAVFLSGLGTAIATHHGGIFAIQNSKKLPLWKVFVPTIQAGILSIYGIIIGVFLASEIGDGSTGSSTQMTTIDGYKNLSSGLCTGLACLASGYGMSKFIEGLNSKVGSSLPPASSSTPEQRQPLLSSRLVTPFDPTDRTVYRNMILSLIFLESIGLYGFIVSLIIRAQ